MCGNDSKEEINLRNLVNGSMDVKALNPSIYLDFAVKKCVEMILKNISTLGIV